MRLQPIVRELFPLADHSSSGERGVCHMQLGRIIGNVVCSIKNDSLEGKKLLLVQPIDQRGKEVGRVLVAVDSVGAGAGEVIYWCRGREASFPWYPDQEVPTDASIVGIVDEIHLEK